MHVDDASYFASVPIPIAWSADTSERLDALAHCLRSFMPVRDFRPDGPTASLW
jgi:hypothetical protein